MPDLPRTAGVLAALIAVSALAADSGEKTLVYRLRGEVRPLLFWIGRDDVGGGRITFRREHLSPDRWREEIEVLFGSDPERTPRRVNRWGYGWERAEWVRENGAAEPKLLSTEFQGFMRRSRESSIKEVAPESGSSPITRTFDVTRSVVEPDLARQERWTFTDPEDFNFRRPERLLARYRTCLATAPVEVEGFSNRKRTYSEPYGFLTALSRLIARAIDMHKEPEALRRNRPSLAFAYNAKPYRLEVVRIRVAESFRARYGTLHHGDVAAIEFRCHNIFRDTDTDFVLWTPLAGDLKGLPLRVVLQPRWWLRLQLDLDPDAQGGRP